MKLRICIPSLDMVHMDFSMDLVNLIGHLFANPPPDFEGLQVSNERGSLVHMTREFMLTNAIQSESTHILFLDSDMRFPSDTVHRLLAHDLDVVCCNYGQRACPVYSNTVGLDGRHVLTSNESTGLEEILSAGFGVMLIKASALAEIPRPYFDTMWTEKEDGYTMVGEDVFFCRKLGHHGIKICVDHDLSKEIGHIGQFVYTNQMAVETVEEAKSREVKEAYGG